MRVHYGEGRSVPHRPRVMRGCREVTCEALTGVCAGQVVSGESNAVRGADAVVAAEGNRGECGGAGRLDRFREEQAKAGSRLKVSPFPESNSILAGVVAL